MRDTEPRQIRLVLGYEHLFFGAVMLLFLMAIFTALTLLISQLANPASVEARNEPAPELLIAVEAVSERLPVGGDTAVSSTRDCRGDGVSSVEPIAEKTSEPLKLEVAPAPSATFLRAESSGGLYLEFGALNPSLASLYARYLSARNLPASTSVGPNGQQNWVRVGPAAGEDQLARLETDLADVGFVAE